MSLWIAWLAQFLRAIKTFVQIVDMKLASADDGGVVEVDPEEKLERHRDEGPAPVWRCVPCIGRCN